MKRKIEWTIQGEDKVLVKESGQEFEMPIKEFMKEYGIERYEIMTDNDIIFELTGYLRFMAERKYGSISDDQHMKLLQELMALLEEDEDEKNG